VVPYSRYVFLNALLETGGGLEHLDSTLMFAGRWRTHDEDDYLGWLGLVSHEFFHTWNIKRLRPVALGPFDYENEVHTRDLWIAEGFTSYYDDLLVRRADLMDESTYLKKLSGNIKRLQTTPGRLVHALGDTSYDAWTEFYRRDANSTNTTISYYTKGTVVAFLLDAEIRRRSRDQQTLDDVMREAYRRYAGEQGYTSEQFRDLASELAGDDLSEWFAYAVDRPEELDYEPALAWFGLRFTPKEDADEDDPPPTGWLGLELGGQNQVTEVRTDTPVFAAGVNVNDEVVGIDSWRVAAGQWSTHAAHYAPGDAAKLLISRRGELRTLPVVFQPTPEATWSLEPDPDAGPAAAARRVRWLAVME
jgi:predicted metalloprotease with PDZ domain